MTCKQAPKSPKVVDEIKLNKTYLAGELTLGNAPKNKPHKSPFHGKKVKVLRNNPENSDIPSFEHGAVHVYNAETNEYYGAYGVFYFARAIGIAV